MPADDARGTRQRLLSTHEKVEDAREKKCVPCSIKPTRIVISPSDPWGADRKCHLTWRKKRFLKASYLFFPSGFHNDETLNRRPANEAVTLPVDVLSLERECQIFSFRVKSAAAREVRRAASQRCGGDATRTTTQLCSSES